MPPPCRRRHGVEPLGKHAADRFPRRRRQAVHRLDGRRCRRLSLPGVAMAQAAHVRNSADLYLPAAASRSRMSRAHARRSGRTQSRGGRRRHAAPLRRLRLAPGLTRRAHGTRAPPAATPARRRAQGLRGSARLPPARERDPPAQYAGPMQRPPRAGPRPPLPPSGCMRASVQPVVFGHPRGDRARPPAQSTPVPPRARRARLPAAPCSTKCG